MEANFARVVVRRVYFSDFFELLIILIPVPWVKSYRRMGFGQLLLGDRFRLCYPSNHDGLKREGLL